MPEDPNISLYILQTVQHTFPKIVTGRWNFLLGLSYSQQQNQFIQGEGHTECKTPFLPTLWKVFGIHNSSKQDGARTQELNNKKQNFSQKKNMKISLPGFQHDASLKREVKHSLIQILKEKMYMYCYKYQKNLCSEALFYIFANIYLIKKNLKKEKRNGNSLRARLNQILSQT